MRTEWRLFGAVALFFIAASALYGWWTWETLGNIEWIGTIALLLTFFLLLMIAGYFWVISRRIEPRPEDRPDAEIEEGAGDVGFFSPGSYYPFGLALSATVVGLGVALWLWWLIIAGFIGVIVTAAGMLFEYHTGSRRTPVA